MTAEQEQLLALLHQLAKEGSYVTVSRRRLGDLLHYSPRTVGRNLVALESAGYIKAEHRFSDHGINLANGYTLLKDPGIPWSAVPESDKLIEDGKRAYRAGLLTAKGLAALWRKSGASRHKNVIDAAKSLGISRGSFYNRGIKSKAKMRPVVATESPKLEEAKKAYQDGFLTTKGLVARWAQESTDFGNIDQAVKALGISRSAFDQAVRELGITLTRRVEAVQAQGS